MRRFFIPAALSVTLAIVHQKPCDGWIDMNATAVGSEVTRQPAVAGVKPAPKPWSEVVGKKVQAEGIAWGSEEKGWGEYVLIDGARVYVEKADFLTRGAFGKLVRVSGVLTAVHVHPAAPDAQGAANEWTIYKIAPAHWAVVDRVEWPWLQEVP